MRTLTIGTLLFLSVVSIAMAADISGTWKFSVDLDNGQGHGDPTFVLEQQGNRLTGTYHGPMGERKITGTVTGETAEFGFDFERDGQRGRATYTAKIESANRMSGTVTMAGEGPGATGKWTAAKSR